MKGLLVSSGTIKDYTVLRSVVDEVDFVVCADGGMNHLAKIEKKPNLIIGDLDSIDIDILNYAEDNNIYIERFSTIKDETDTFLAMDYLINKGCKDITLMGVTGTRQDHTLANILLLNILHDKKIKGKIIDDNNIIFLVDDYLELDFNDKRYISIVPITESGIILSLEGFYYNLNRESIKFGSTQCISNRVIDDFGVIKIHHGKALVFESKD